MIQLDFSTINQLDAKSIIKLIKYHQENLLPKYEKMENYYNGNHESIMNRTMEDELKPNNKIINNFPQYIVDTAQGFFLGKPVSYNYNDDAISEETYSNILKRNNEPSHNAAISLSMGKYGEAFELLYQDEDSNTRFTEISPKEFLPIYDTKLNGGIGLGLRYYEVTNPLNTKKVIKVELYWKDRTEYYTLTNNNLLLNETSPNYFDNVRIVHYKNNEDAFNDFERILPLIDDYDLRMSDRSNELDFSRSAYLLVIGMDLSNEESRKQFKAMKESGGFGLPEGTDMKFLTKDVPDTFTMNHLKELKENIHRFSMVPNLTDENFASNLSGVAIRYKLWGLEQLAGRKEMQFRKGLRRRMELISQILNIKNVKIDINNIEPVFVRNMPQNVIETAEMVAKLKGQVPDSKLLAQLPFIEDPEAALEELSNAINIDNNQNNTKPSDVQ